MIGQIVAGGRCFHAQQLWGAMSVVQHGCRTTLGFFVFVDCAASCIVLG